METFYTSLCVPKWAWKSKNKIKDTSIVAEISILRPENSQKLLNIRLHITDQGESFFCAKSQIFTQDLEADVRACLHDISDVLFRAEQIKLVSQEYLVSYICQQIRKAFP